MAGDESGWEHFPHMADIGVRGFGPSRESAFEQAAVALTAVVTDPAVVRPERAVEVACRAADDEFLLVEWLNAVVYEMAVKGMLFGRFRVEIEAAKGDGAPGSDGLSLRGTAWGEPIDHGRHQPAAEVKGATLTALRVARDSDGRWVAECVVDV
ncbi:MAG: archease [Alphaproteobacteria bacterium]